MPVSLPWNKPSERSVLSAMETHVRYCPSANPRDIYHESPPPYTSQVLAPIQLLWAPNSPKGLVLRIFSRKYSLSLDVAQIIGAEISARKESIDSTVFSYYV
jgi:hypothetical protein